MLAFLDALAALARPAAAGGQPGAAAGSVSPGSVTPPTGAGLPAALVLMAGLAGAIGLIAAVAGVARVRGWDPTWAARRRHAWHEAGYRISAAWSEFVDWLHSA